MGIEGYLYNLEKDHAEHLTAFRCANCHFYEDRDGAHYCGRRERTFKWDPGKCYCTEYGAGDDLDEWEERIFPHEEPSFSDFLEETVRIVNPRQTTLDDWADIPRDSPRCIITM